MDPNDGVATVAGTRDDPAQEEAPPSSLADRVNGRVVAQAEPSTIVREAAA